MVGIGSLLHFVVFVLAQACVKRKQILISQWIRTGMCTFIFPHVSYQAKVHSHPWFTPACTSAIAHHNHNFEQDHVQGSLESKCLFHKPSDLCKRVLEDAKQQYAASVADSIATQLLGLRGF